MSVREHDAQDLAETVNLVREAFPDALAIELSTSDQGLVGFILDDVILPNAGRATFDWPARFAELQEDVWPLVSSLGWDGLLGEDCYGNAYYPLPA